MFLIYFRITKSLYLIWHAAILTNEVAWFDINENNTASLTAMQAADAALVRSALADRLSTLVQNIALTITAFVIAFTMSWKLTLVVAACLPFLIGAYITEVNHIIKPLHYSYF
jgi:ATP-binding cassette, subfamily B (MDR/TAP), member 1